MEFLRKNLQRVSVRKLFLLGVIGIFLIQFTACTVITESVPEQFPGFDRGEVKTYYMKQKIWTIGDQFLVKNHYGKPVFYIKGKIFTLGDRLKLYNMDGNELLYIKQKLLSLNRRYKIYRDHRLYAKVIKKLILFKNKYVIDVDGPDDYIIRGDFFNYRYNIFFRGKKVASISQKW